MVTAVDPSGHRGVLVVAGALDERGGLQLRTVELARHLAVDVPVTLLTWEAGLRRPHRERDEDGLAVVRVPALASWGRDHPATLSRANTAVSVAAGVTAAVALWRRWSAAWCTGLVPEGLTGAVAAGLLGRTFVVDTWLPGPLGNVARLVASPIAGAERRLLARAAAIVAETGEVVGELVGAGFPPERVRVVPWGVDLGRFRPPSPAERRTARTALGIPDDRGVVVYTGRFDLRQKRLDVLLDAWARRPLSGWSLLLAGDGPDAAVVRARAGGVPGVRVLPWQPDVRALLWSADAFCLPTEFETTGLAVVEAMACGLAGVVSATTGYREMAPAGVTLVANEPAAWAAALAALADPARRSERGAAARAWAVSRHDLAATLATVRALLGIPEIPSA
jgi:glycosyltransferase involved in cell wall biosynthesis